MTHRWKSLLAGVLVTAALVGPAAVLSADAPREAELHIEGAALNVMPDGSVQAVFQISVDKVENSNGASITLDYNPDYLTPSDMKTNAPYTGQSLSDNDAFFAYDPGLYLSDVNPFAEKIVMMEGFNIAELPYTSVDLSKNQIALNLWLDRDKINQEAGKLKLLGYYDESGTSPCYAFNVSDGTADYTPEKVALGAISFQVNKARLPEIVQHFGMDMIPTEDPVKTVTMTVPTATTNPSTGETIHGTKTETYSAYLLKTARVADAWSIRYYDGGDYNKTNKFYSSNDTVKLAAALYDEEVEGKTIVNVRCAEEDVTINAYQAYTYGTEEDIALALGRYSPMATITYADGSEENAIIPWGREDQSYHVAGLADPYDPTQGTYTVTQFFPDRLAYPVPITARLTVTPIRLLSLEVEDQERTYDLREVVGQVRSPTDLKLPDEARLITDVVPGGVSMVIPIPGWRPLNGKWPVAAENNSTTLMNSLLEDTYDSAAAQPYWPDEADAASLPSHDGQSQGSPEKFTHMVNIEYEEDGTTVKSNCWLGSYTFRLAESYVAADGDPAFKSGFTKSELQTQFPWLTVPNEEYPVPEAKRFLVLSGGAAGTEEDHFTDPAEYTASWVSTVTGDNAQPTLTLQVKRKEGAMAEGSQFRVWLPDGMELGTGLTATLWYDDTKTISVDDWFPKTMDNTTEPPTVTYQNGSYAATPVKDSTDQTYFHLVTNPGDPTVDDWQTQRETLRRHINLGGWFQISVCEDTSTHNWSDPMPVYVPPRPNLYTESKTYNFLGLNQGLLHWPSNGLTRALTLPRGTYTLVNDKGEPLYKDGVTARELSPGEVDAFGRPLDSVPRASDSYGYTTTYDGLTGAQPGRAYTFRVGAQNTAAGDLWAETGWESSVYRYGPTLFYHGASYPAYGQVFQESEDTPAPYTATIRRDTSVEDPVPPTPDDGQIITLTCDRDDGITREDPNDRGSNVTLATYNAQTVGYTSREDYTFVITNISQTRSVYGLSIDLESDGYVNEPQGGRFVLLQPPADCLGPGESTTFVMTYVYNLGANIPKTANYRDTIYITSSDHPKGGNKDCPDANYRTPDADYLLSFDAQFHVASQATHSVTLVVKPTGDDGSLNHGPMGNADLIVGEENIGSTTMNYTTTTRTYAKDDKVYVVVDPKDEYSIQSVTCVDAVGVSHLIQEYTAIGGAAEIRDGSVVYVFDMPEYDATVTVNFYEDDYSKLRLFDLIDFSAYGENIDSVPLIRNKDTDVVAAKDTYPVWRKTFTQAEEDAAQAWAEDPVRADSMPAADLSLMTKGKAITPQDVGRKFVPSEHHYLVVIPYEANYSQVQAKFRQLEVTTDCNGTNENLTGALVTMTRFGADVEETWTLGTDNLDPVLNSSVGVTAGILGTTDPSVDSRHISKIFDSPEPGTSNYVRITLAANDVSRTYYLEIHRMPKEPTVTLHYGNSPYGMIMNAENFKSYDSSHNELPQQTQENREAAKRAFLRNGCSFRGLAPAYLPAVITQDDPATTQSVVYWPEAWVKNTRLYEKESLTGFILGKTTGDDGLALATTAPDPTVYDPAENLDLNDYAFFATLWDDMQEPGVVSALDSSGRPVDLKDIRARVTVTLLDDAADSEGTVKTQVERFSGAQTATLDLGRAGRLLTGLSALPADTAPTGSYWQVSSSVTVDPDTGAETTAYAPVAPIRPGQYVLEYYYTDYDGNAETPLVVTRPFVLLPQVGDINADGTVDSTRHKAASAAASATDEFILENRVSDPLGYEAGGIEKTTVDGADIWTETVYPRANIFKFRVVDVNNDRNVNNIDGNLIDQNLRRNQPFFLFYNPVTYK